MSTEIPIALEEDERVRVVEIRGVVISLTVRQSQVMQRLTEGKSDKEISNEIGVSEERVADLLRRLFKIFSVRNRTALVIAYTRTCRV